MPELKVRFIGLDVHKDTIAIAVADEGRSAAHFVTTVSSDFESLVKQLKRLSKGGALKLCYEAGPTGFDLCRKLKEAGYDCQVIAPSLMPTKPGDRIKTDRRDAQKLATCLRAGDLTEVYVPDSHVEALRDLERCRTAARKAQTSARHQLGKFLLRQGFQWERSNWTKAHMTWIRALKFEHESHRCVVREYLTALEEAVDRVERLTKDIERLIETSTLAPLITAMQSLRGVGMITSVVIAAEIGDLRRFSSAGAFMSYLGLVPSENSTGSRKQRGSITKTGNKHVRSILVESAWHYMKPHRVSGAVKRRREKVSPEVLQIARKAEYRLQRKFQTLLLRRKPSQVAAVAVARELAGFLWAIGQEENFLCS